MVNAPLTTSAILDRPSDSHAARERLAALFDRHQRRLFRLALRLASDREEAHDLVQEVFLRAARSPRSLPAGDSPGEAWLVRTLVNLCRDRYRRLAVRARGWQELGRREDHGDPEAGATVRHALARLSPRRRAVIVLCELEGRPARDAARLLGVSEVTVRWHRLAARRDLARLLLEPAGAAPAGGER